MNHKISSALVESYGENGEGLKEYFTGV